MAKMKRLILLCDDKDRKTAMVNVQNFYIFLEDPFVSMYQNFKCIYL